MVLGQVLNKEREKSTDLPAMAQDGGAVQGIRVLVKGLVAGRDGDQIAQLVDEGTAGVEEDDRDQP